MISNMLLTTSTFCYVFVYIQVFVGFFWHQNSFFLQKVSRGLGKCSVYHTEQLLWEDDFQRGCQRGFKLELAFRPPAIPNGEPQMEKLTRSPHLLANSRKAVGQ